MDPDEYDVKTYTVTVTAVSTQNQGLYGETVEITVEAAEAPPPPPLPPPEGGGEAQTVTGVNANTIETKLNGLPDNDEDTAHTLVFDESVNFGNTSTWPEAIINALTTTTKYVVLDLSACSVEADTSNAYLIKGSATVSTSIYFNAIARENGASRIKGIIFPDCLTKIGASICVGFIALERVTIPAGVVSFASSAFKTNGENPNNLNRITIKNNTKINNVHLYFPTITELDKFAACYNNAATDYAGVYTLTGGEWERTDLPPE
jgi:hypothetical protein